MESDISGLLEALKDWKKAVRQISKKGKSVQNREKHLQRANQDVLHYLNTDSVAHKIDQLIEDAIARNSLSVEEIRSTLIKHPQPLMSIELMSVHPLNLSQKELEKLIDNFLQKSDAEKPITSSEELQAIFSQVSPLILQETKAISTLSRKPKKRRKRDLAMGTLHIAIGIGLLAGNTQLEQYDAAKYSYILGGNALLTAMRNFVGELEIVLDAST